MRSARILWLLLLTSACFSQTRSPITAASPDHAPRPNGIVTGRVICADTGRPARLAEVSLVPIDYDPLDRVVTSAHHHKPVDIISVRTALDGSYVFTHASSGTYYVVAIAEGYINFHTLAYFSDETRKLIHQFFPSVDVEQNSTIHADIQLQRGAAVNGTITYDDGLPASHIKVSLRSKDKDGQWRTAPAFSMSLFTDDQGRYRLLSILAGTYVLAAGMDVDPYETHSQPTESSPVPVSQSYISFFGNGTSYIEQADTLTLSAGEERTNVNMTLPISKLHKLSGRIAAADAKDHFVNSASLELISTTTSKPVTGTTIDRNDPFFRFNLVPEGDYTLHISQISDLAFTTEGGESVLKSYADIEIPIVLRGDMLDITLIAKPKEEDTPTESN